MSQQDILSRDRVWPRPKVLVSRHNILCHDTTFCVTTQHFVSRHNILCRDKAGQGQEFHVATKYFYVATEFGLGQGSCVATEYFYVVTELAEVRRNYVATEQILCRHRVVQGRENFCCNRGF